MSDISYNIYSECINSKDLQYNYEKCEIYINL